MVCFVSVTLEYVLMYIGHLMFNDNKNWGLSVLLDMSLEFPQALFGQTRQI